MVTMLSCTKSSHIQSFKCYELCIIVLWRRVSYFFPWATSWDEKYWPWFVYILLRVHSKMLHKWKSLESRKPNVLNNFFSILGDYMQKYSMLLLWCQHETATANSRCSIYIFVEQFRVINLNHNYNFWCISYACVYKYYNN